MISYRASGANSQAFLPRLVPALAATTLLLLAWQAAQAQTELSPETALLREEVGLAKSKSFYLVLLPAQRRLDLRISGVTLRRFELQDSQIGQSRIASGAEAMWPAVSFRLVSEVEEPDRPLIVPPKSGTEAGSVPTTDANSGDSEAAAPAAPPPSLAESLAQSRARAIAGAPSVYRLHFEPALDLVVRGEPIAEDWNSRVRRLWFRLNEGWTGAWHWLRGEPITTRVTLFMLPEDARRLHMTLVPSIPLLVSSGSLPSTASIESND